MTAQSFTLRPRAPFRLDLTVWVLRRVAINQMDRWDGETYRRILAIDDEPIEVALTQIAPPSEPVLRVVSTGGSKVAVRSMLEKMLGLNIDLRPFIRMAKSDRRLAELIKPFSGLKPPRLASVFETFCNGIACQQVSLIAGMHFLNRLSATFGLSMDDNHAFPRPGDLARISPSRLRPLGFSGSKARAIISAARDIAEGRLDLESLARLDNPAALERLLQIKGIGRWTAEYILLRGMGRIDVFPAGDIGGQNKIQRWLGLKTRPGHEQLQRLIAPWEPYRGLLYFYLLLNQQREHGLV